MPFSTDYTVEKGILLSVFRFPGEAVPASDLPKRIRRKGLSAQKAL